MNTLKMLIIEVPHLVIKAFRLMCTNSIDFHGEISKNIYPVSSFIWSDADQSVTLCGVARICVVCFTVNVLKF